ncbi:glycosyltransferase family 1 protein [Thalassotalea litorea]|uniref:Glycosyltransferase family 1 protein n=1 Tax=Thalassotalea litorea TaxID=2020715 RepID=A0A5R9IRB8_9GAMM|nr:glycosyltransferase [Thalassotalea litorea]TLU65766.1 glycosyltransferase family 1 protein [Thalassotalea litorea]
MNNKWDVIYIGNEYSTDNRTSSHHIAKRLAAQHNLLYVEAAGLRLPRFSLSDLKKIWSRLNKAFKAKPKTMVSDFTVLSLFLLPFPSSWWISRVNKKRAIAQIKRKAEALEFSERPIVWCTVPTLAEVIEQLCPQAIIYYCVDDFSALPGVNQERVIGLDKQLSKQADLIFTPSMPLFERKRKEYEQVLLSPHGVDVAHFSQANLPGPIPPELAQIQGPVVGFFGLIEYWIDIELVCFVARQLPDVTCVLIGRVTVDLRQFDIPENVRFIGQRSYEQLPDFARRFDVAIIPYVLNQQVFNSNPLKLREYLATGKPVVSVSCPEIDKYQDVVSIAQDYQEFANLVAMAIANDDQQASNKRQRVVAKDTWESRYNKVCQHVEAILKNKKTMEQ